jgi:hypothetical protein
MVCTRRDEVRRAANIKDCAIIFKIVPNILKYCCFVQLRKKIIGL